MHSMTAARRKRPRDPNQLGKLVIDIAVGEVEDRTPLIKVSQGGKEIILNTGSLAFISAERDD